MAYRESAQPKPTPEELEAAASELVLVAELKKRRRRLTLGIAAGAMLLIGAFYGPALVAGIAASRAREEVPLEPAIARDVKDRLNRIGATVQKSQVAFEAIWPRLRDGAVGMRKDLGPCPGKMPSPNVLEERDVALLAAADDAAPASRWLYIDLAADSGGLGDALLQRSAGSAPDSVTITRRPRLAPRGAQAPILDSTHDADRANDLKLEAARLIRRDQHDQFVKRVNRFVDEALPLDVVVLLDAWKNTSLNIDDDGIGRGPTTTGYAIARAFAWSPAEARVVCASQAIAYHAPPGTHVSVAGIGEFTVLVENLEHELAASWSVSSVGPPRLEVPVLPPTPRTPSSFTTHDYPHAR